MAREVQTLFSVSNNPRCLGPRGTEKILDTFFALHMLNRWSSPLIWAVGLFVMYCYEVSSSQEAHCILKCQLPKHSSPAIWFCLRIILKMHTLAVWLHSAIYCIYFTLDICFYSLFQYCNYKFKFPLCSAKCLQQTVQKRILQKCLVQLRSEWLLRPSLT